jgi:hypothetical protein
MFINNVEIVQSPEEIRKKIEFLKKELIKVVQHYGLNSKEAIAISQKLDLYINNCQKCCPKENRK